MSRAKEALLEAVFDGTVAKGTRNGVAGSSQAQSTPVPVQEHSVEDLLATADLASGNHQVPLGEDQAPEGLVDSHATEAVFSDLDAGTFSCPTQLPTRADKRKKKGQANGGVGARKTVRKTAAQNLWQQQMQSSIDANQVMMTVFQNEAQSQQQASNQPVDKNREALNIVGQMVEEGLLRIDDKLWGFAVFSLQKETFQTTFLNLDDNYARLKFLEYALADKKGDV